MKNDDLSTKITKLLNLSRNFDSYSDEDLVIKALSITPQIYQEQIQRFKGKGFKNICTAPLVKESIFYQCFECMIDGNHVLCNDCFIKENHKNHMTNYEYSTLYRGFCDCGDFQMLKKESFCLKHKQNEQQLLQQSQVDNEFKESYEEYLNISFCLLFNLIDQIVDYPSQFNEFVEVALNFLSEADIIGKAQQSLNQLNNQQKIVDDVLQVRECIFKVLKQILKDNVVLSQLTSQIFYKPINEHIQIYLPMRHVHSKDAFQRFQIGNYFQKCNCSILQLYVKYESFLCNLKNDYKQDISSIFFELSAEQYFFKNLCKCIAENFKSLYRQYYQYQITTTNGLQTTLMINKEQFKQFSMEQVILKEILKSKWIKNVEIQNGAHCAELFQYFMFIYGHFGQSVMQLYKDTKDEQYYSFLQVYQEVLLFIPLYDISLVQVIVSFNEFISLQFRAEVVQRMIDEINELQTQNSIDDSKSQGAEIKLSHYKNLQKSSFLIQVLTKICPCTRISIKKFDISPNENSNVQYQTSLLIQSLPLAKFRNLLQIVITTQNDVWNRNLIETILNYFFNNLPKIFQINYNESPLVCFLRNQVMGDRNFISILAVYLQEFCDPQIAYQNLRKVSQDSIQFKSVLQSLLHRTMLNYVVLSNFENYGYYQGNYKILEDLSQKGQISLRYIDLTYFQLYAYLFGSQGINQILDCFIEISHNFEIKANPQIFLCHIAQSDYEYFQTIAFFKKGQISEEFKNSISKVFQTIFFSYSFLAYKQIIEILQDLSLDSVIDYQTLILSSCELNQNNNQIQLKKELKPTYEPIFALQSYQIFQNISDKLCNQQDSYTTQFGNALEVELSHPKSTLSQLRKTILYYFSQDQQQKLLKSIVNTLFNLLEENQQNQIVQFLEQNSLFINLLSLVNKYFKPENQVITKCLHRILFLCKKFIEIENKLDQNKELYRNYVKLLEGKSIKIPQEQDPAKLKNLQTKKVLMQKKYQQMGQKVQQIEDFDPQIDQDSKCLICHQPFTQTNQMCQLILIQKTNKHKYFHHLPDINSYNNLFILQFSTCNHEFHVDCLNKNESDFTLNGDSYYFCSACSQPYNFILTVQNEINHKSIQIIINTLINYFQIINKENLEYYYKKFQVTDELDLKSAMNELFSQGLCNLLYQLTSNVKVFVEKGLHLILQTITKVLQFIYKHGQQNLIVNQQFEDQSILMKFIFLFNQNIIQQDDISQFKASISNLFKQDQIDLICDILVKRKIQNQTQTIIKSLDNQQYKVQLQKDLAQRLGTNFKEFYTMYCLSPCNKKKCNPTGFAEFQPERVAFEHQYICLICFKKMCYFCKVNSKNNLMNHNLKKHEGKTLFVQIRTGMIFVVMGQLCLILENVLFMSLIGEQVKLVWQHSEYYEKFLLNQVAINQIIDLIYEEKFVNLMFSNKQNVTKMDQ